MSHSLLFILFSCLSPADQPDYPVTWHIISNKTGSNTYDIRFEAYINEGWVIYGMESSSGGPVPTSFSFEEMKDVEFNGKTAELTKAVSKYEPLFDTEVLKFSQKAIFSQKVSQLGNSNVVKGKINYMACDGSKCLPPTDVPFMALLK